MQERAPTPQAELDINRLEKEMELYSQEKLCYEAQILRVGIFFPALKFLLCCNFIRPRLEWPSSMCIY